MTDETTPILPSTSTDAEAVRFTQIWAESFTHVLSQVVGSPFPVECLAQTPPEASVAAETDLQIILVAAGGLRGEMGLRIPQAVTVAVAQTFLGQPRDPAGEFQPDYKEAAEELLRQVAGHAASGLKPHWGEVQLRLESGTRPSWAAGASGWLISGSIAAFPVSVEWQLSAALHAALVTAARPAETQPLAAPLAAMPPALANEPQANNLNLLRDVELEVILRFGECSMLLRDVLELGEGSVVELDRRVQEPVDLLLDGKLIARGEVVVVDGNYGLRVQEVMSPVVS